MIMKKILSIFASIALAALCISCQKGDGDAEYGNILVYIPQAMTNGSIDNVYAVPGGDAERTYNFKAEGDVVNVFLGVYRSGKINAKEVTVNVAVDDAESQAQASAAGAAVMPSSLYTLPSSAKVEAGKNATSFYLALSKSALQDAANAGKTYILCVRISNPSNYQLNEDASVVVVKLDVDALKALI